MTGCDGQSTERFNFADTALDPWMILAESTLQTIRDVLEQNVIASNF